MHYADGTEAKVGDLVKGTCYNTKNADGSPRVVVGIMVEITPGADTCNCKVAVAEVLDVAKEAADALNAPNVGLWYQVGGTYLNRGPARVRGFLDYSECKAFTLVHRPES